MKPATGHASCRRALNPFHIAIFWLVIVATVLGSAKSLAAETQQVPVSTMNDGGLFLPADRAGYVVPATTVDTDVHIEVNGMVARARVTQRFVNPTDDWVEGVYVFPLPENAAVDRLRLLIGERQVIGEIMERAAARQAYEQARDAGQRASLVSQERPNIFTNAVANIPPGEAITVEIEYQEALDYRDEAFSLRFPMVVLPRYIPGDAIASRPDSGTGWSFDTDRVPDASRITPPVAAPGTGPINPLRLSVALAPGFLVGSLESPHHAIDVTERPDGSYVIELARADVYTTRDFELVWRPVVSAVPTAGVFTEQQGEFDYHLIMVMPPEEPGAVLNLPREMVFVIDTSGSMAGDSIVQAREALRFALDRLGPDDRFNIIAFNDQPTSLFTHAQPVSLRSLEAGRRFVDGLIADGGTEMRSALQLALAGPVSEEAFRQIVFITDGSVGNEAELFGLIHSGIGNSRLFTVGIGSAPNSFFMTQAAESGRGTFTYIGSTAQMAERMGDLFARLASPALTDIRIAWPDGSAAHSYPGAIPDLYLGEPVIVSARTPAGTAGEITVSGDRGAQTFISTTELNAGQDAAGVAALWARAQIGSHGLDLSADQVRRVHDAGCWIVQNPRSNHGNGVGYPRALAASDRVALGTDGYPARMDDEVQALREHAAAHGDDMERVEPRIAAGRRLVGERFGGRFELPRPGGAPTVADLRVVEPDGAVRHVLVDGQVVVRDGVLLGGDLEAIRKEAQVQAQRLWARMAQVVARS